MASAWLHRLFVLVMALLATVLAAAALSPARASADTPPSNSSAPTVSVASGGEPAVGRTLVASPGSWTGSPSPSYTYEWYECDSSGANCADTNHGGSTYTLSDADYAHEVEVLVTAANSAGSRSVMSAPVYIAGSMPTVVDQPTLSGGTAVGNTLTTTSGTWSGYPTPQVYAYTWWDCTPGGSDGTGCTQSTTATSSDSPTYKLTAADVGHQVQAEVFVDNGQHASTWSTLSAPITRVSASTSGSVPAGSSAPAAGSSPSAPAGGTGALLSPQLVSLPSPLTAPRIHGTVRVGRTLRATHGIWSGSPATYAYSWWTCRSARSCRRIRGATASRYRVTGADAGRRLAVHVTAFNGAGASRPMRSGLTRRCRTAGRVHSPRNRRVSSRPRGGTSTLPW